MCGEFYEPNSRSVAGRAFESFTARVVTPGVTWEINVDGSATVLGLLRMCLIFFLIFFSALRLSFVHFPEFVEIKSTAAAILSGSIRTRRWPLSTKRARSCRLNSIAGIKLHYNYGRTTWFSSGSVDHYI